MIIKSVQNQIFKEALNIQDKKFRDENGFFFVEGKKQIDEIPSDWTVKQFFISENYKNYITDFKNIVTLSERLFNKLSAVRSPQGIMAVVKKKCYDVKEVVKNTGLFIILDNIQDPGNLGTIIRSADAFGVKAVFVSKRSADIYSDKTLRATMGSIFHLPVLENIDIKNLLMLMKKENISVFAASLKGEKYLNTVKFPSKSVFIVGNEAHGLQNDVESSADMIVRIHMSGAESLNAAVAASIIMYEMSKQLSLHN
ncbi:MAG: RNA methyltransferase [Endomicrobium sp.]|jgi:TrmH family RNA methyltransferase|nr:RNA methyltransferase [Endomicrobium sp.]